MVKWAKLFNSIATIDIDYNDRRKIYYNLYINEIIIIKAEKENNQVEAKIAKIVKILRKEKETFLRVLEE